jgi:hypothetical protein
MEVFRPLIRRQKNPDGRITGACQRRYVISGEPGWRTASEEERREFVKWLSQQVDLEKYLRRR